MGRFNMQSNANTQFNLTCEHLKLDVPEFSHTEFFSLRSKVVKNQPLNKDQKTKFIFYLNLACLFNDGKN